MGSTGDTLEYDLFISHAFEDKDAVARPLATELSSLGVRVWYDEFALQVGDSVSESIDRGLSRSRFGVLVLSKVFFQKFWTNREKGGLVARAVTQGNIILPIWHNVTYDDVVRYSPTLADTYALDTNKQSKIAIVLAVLSRVRPDIHKGLTRRLLWLKAIREGRSEIMPIEQLRRGDIRHESLPEHVLVRARLVHQTLFDVVGMSLETLIDAYRKDVYPEDELSAWEKMAAAYLVVVQGMDWSVEKRREVFQVILGASVGMLTAEQIDSLDNLNHDEVHRVLEAYAHVVPHVREEQGHTRPADSTTN